MKHLPFLVVICLISFGGAASPNVHVERNGMWRNAATPGGGFGRRLRRSVTVLAAAALTAAAWLVGRAAGVDYIAETPLGTRQVTLVQTIAATILVGLAGWGVATLLDRFTASARTIWTSLGIIVLAMSIVPLFAVRGDASSQIALSVLHCVAAAVLIPGLLPARPPLGHQRLEA
ncbi:DUF6069 family protein [Mycobacterium sp. 1482292.6]|uniref:DUF6069 family protein n=1 Tax=Mycobacterium sp. 1482292.6 TaxID=1834081 RepID=UPI0012E9B8D4|nr:DUF6069 family protein [Mycobacterium sp. 1482292.6]